MTREVPNNGDATGCADTAGLVEHSLAFICGFSVTKSPKRVFAIPLLLALCTVPVDCRPAPARFEANGAHVVGWCAWRSSIPVALVLVAVLSAASNMGVVNAVPMVLWCWESGCC